VARALAPLPALVLLDEPFGPLDTTLRGSVRNDVRTALRADGATGVLVTHDQEEALSIADLVAVIRDGRLVQVGTPDEIYNNPADLGVARFVGESVVLPATSTSSDLVTCTLGSIPVRAAATGAGVVVLRPEQFRLVGDGIDTARAADATVTATTYHGHDALVAVQLSDGSNLCVRVLGAPSVRIGDRVGVAVDGTGSFFTE
jgi:iron(III) transport system ATP-binding protein